ncbi:hypothetical protein EJB05_37286 [Eragrostis curvula]|uniref:Pectin acetylesterase n=1 Tax=Eragrostis curvula TaxID=38414 RepID=A0A5J9TRH0_9POAL|nr:hypothetical protein EJB05_37286 [Eragrostis curvula]
MRAVRRETVCLDGSPPGYQLQRGFRSGARNWLIYFQKLLQLACEGGRKNMSLATLLDG